MKIMLKITILVSICITWFSASLGAHPGRTAADGCHYCRTNCEKWGVEQDARHCHNGNRPDQGIQMTPINYSNNDDNIAPQKSPYTR